MLVIGGDDGAGGSGYIFRAVELYDASTNTWSFAGYLNQARFSHTATLLPNSNVLVVEGHLSGTLATNTAELYNVSTDESIETGSLWNARCLHTATLLANGKVLVAGGLGSASQT